MAIPFGPYQGQDLTNWQAGNKFLPREFYSLKTTPSTTLANQIGNTGGITGTQAAGPYMGYPSYEAWLLAQGGGGGGNGGGGRDDIITNPYNPNQNLGPTNITDYESEAYGVGPTWAGSWAKFKDEYSKLPTPTNLAIRGWKGIQRWRENKKIERAEAAKAAEISSGAMSDAQKEDAPTGGYQGPRTYDFDPGQARREGRRADKPGGFTDPGRDSYGPHRAEGGRIGYRNGEFVDENINVEGPGFDVNENIEMASSPHPDESWLGLWEELDGKGMVPLEIETLDDFKHWFHQQDFDMGSMSEDQGIASLV